jgi:hypothetical protein
MQNYNTVVTLCRRHRWSLTLKRKCLEFSKIQHCVRRVNVGERESNKTLQKISKRSTLYTLRNIIRWSAVTGLVG